MVACGGCASQSQLTEMNWQSLSSDAADGSVLAQQIVDGRASAVFARAHAAELQDDVDQVQLNVSDEKLPGYQQMAQLANDLSSALSTMVVQPDDPSVAQQAKAALKDLSDKISQASS
jgi:hypothetical protein